MIPRRRGAAVIALLLMGCSDDGGTAHDTVIKTELPTSATTPGPTTGAPTTTAPTTTTATIVTATTSTAASSSRATSTTVAVLKASRETPAAPKPPKDPKPLGQPTSPAEPTEQSQPSQPTLPVPVAPPDPAAIEAVVELGSIEIPRLGLNKSLFEGITISTLNRGPGHWPGTALPGARGNVVVGGHRTSKSRPFRHLERLVPGDEVIFTTGAGRYVYHVVRTEIVTPDSMWIVSQTQAYTATLFACHPVGSTKERIVVFLELGV